MNFILKTIEYIHKKVIAHNLSYVSTHSLK